MVVIWDDGDHNNDVGWWWWWWYWWWWCGMARVESEQVTGELELVRRHQGWMDGHVGWGDIKMQKREKYARFFPQFHSLCFFHLLPHALNCTIKIPFLVENGVAVELFLFVLSFTNVIQDLQIQYYVKVFYVDSIWKWRLEKHLCWSIYIRVFIEGILLFVSLPAQTSPHEHKSPSDWISLAKLGSQLRACRHTSQSVTITLNDVDYCDSFILPFLIECNCCF